MNGDVSDQQGSDAFGLISQSHHEADTITLTIRCHSYLSTGSARRRFEHRLVIEHGVGHHRPAAGG